MRAITTEITSLLETNGWTVECERPLELRHEDGSFATLQAADTVIEDLCESMAEESEPREAKPLTQAAAFDELVVLDSHVHRYVTAAGHESLNAEGSAHAQEAWETAYGLVFSDEVSKRVETLLAVLNSPLAYHDPAGSHQDGVRAYRAAIAAKTHLLRPFFA